MTFMPSPRFVKYVLSWSNNILFDSFPFASDRQFLNVIWVFFYLVPFAVSEQLAEKLNVITDIQQAVKYEEFMASMSRRYMEDMTKVLKGEILEHAQKRASDLMQQYTRLRSLYAEQDALVG